MTRGGGNRDWGYASSDDKGNLTYTSYEKDGSVNRYSDNGDGGHSHSHWDNKDDYNIGKDSDWERQESNDHGNPSTGEVQENGGCYLTSACINHFKNNFNDECYELTLLRWFRDNLVSKNDTIHYYEIAPIIVSEFNNSNNSDLMYDYIYNSVIIPCVIAIENQDYKFAYNKYKNSILILEETFVKPILKDRLIKTLKKVNTIKRDCN